MKFIRSNIYLILLVLFSLLVLFLNIKINIFRYDNFDLGKFDLGNMTQMVWNTLQGRVLYLTDYFGTNLPRWSMSHVDPILLIFVPVFALYQHPLTLVFSQLVLVIFSSVLVYLIAAQELKSKFAAFLLGLSFLFYPAVGFLTAWTGFHGVTAVIPFFLGAFYVYEKMHKENNFTRKGLIIFWILLVLTMMGKEQLPLYIILYGIFIWLFRSNFRVGVQMMVVGALWFIMAFFVIIPQYAHYRIEGYQRFARSLGISDDLTRNVVRPNYFLSRYEGFGDSYLEIAFNMVRQPKYLVRVFFAGDKIENLHRTFAPVGYLPLAFPPVLMLAAPDFAANYLTTAEGIGTAEIYNHRVSMIVPVMFLSVIFAVGWLSGMGTPLLKPLIRRMSQQESHLKTTRTGKTTRSRLINILNKLEKHHLIIFLSGMVLFLNIVTTFTYNNPVYLWFTQAIERRLPSFIAFAKTDIELASRDDLEIGEVVKVSQMDSKDRQCAAKVVRMIPDGVSVSGPDYLGAHLSMRETYAIFPALYKEADYVIVDVFSRKIMTILDAPLTLVGDVVGDLIKNENYQLIAGCSNLFIFQNVGPHGKETLLPIQERYQYEEKVDYEIFEGLTVVDYEIPEEVTRGVTSKAMFTFVKRESSSLDDYYLFITFVNKDTGELYQMANLPSFGLLQIRDWTGDLYYRETHELALPAFMDPGEYRMLVGMTNNIRTRSIYLGDVSVR